MGNCQSSKRSRQDASQAAAESSNHAQSMKSHNTAISAPAYERTQSVIIMQDPTKQDANQEQAGGNKRERLANLFVKPLENTENYEFPVHEKTEEETALIKKAIEKNFIFMNLEQDQCQTLLKAFEKYSARAKDIIITEGEVGDYFYVVATGSVSFSIGKQNVGRVGAGEHFGELALLYDCPRAATCSALEDTELWRVDQNTFRQILAKTKLSGDQELLHALRKVPFLKDLEKKFLTTLASAAHIKSYKTGEVIIKKGDEGDVFYILKEGEVAVTDIDLGGNIFDDQVLKSGEYFGERAIVKKEPRVANITATKDTDTYCISREVFLKVLGPLEALVLKSNDIRKLRSIPALKRSDITDTEFIDMVSLVTEQNKSEGTILYTENKETTCGIYILRTGKVEIKSSSSRIEDKIITQGGYFGVVDTLLPKGETALSTATVLEDCTFGFLSADNIEHLIHNIERLNSVPDVKATPKLELKDLKKHRILGVGTFGKVWLVSHEENGKTEAYALKIQRKQLLLKSHQVNGVIREMKLMSKLDHPFVLKLVNVYQNPDSVFMLIKLVQGGELYSLMKKARRQTLSERDGRFYASGILSGLAYMHRRQILYRDLKPENVLIDRDGYTTIVDLGFAKVVPDQTFTLCGTPWYIAPEVILGRGHDKGCDYWSWAILVHEMCAGETPFQDYGTDQMTLFKAIVRGKKKVSRRLSEECQDLVKQILVTKSSHRLGCLAGGDKDIREHPWLADVNFTKLVHKKFRAPWKPDIKDALDVREFDNWDHMNTSDHDAPLSTIEQLQFNAIDNIMQ